MTFALKAEMGLNQWSLSEAFAFGNGGADLVVADSFPATFGDAMLLQVALFMSNPATLAAGYTSAATVAPVGAGLSIADPASVSQLWLGSEPIHRLGNTPAAGVPQHACTFWLPRPVLLRIGNQVQVVVPGYDSNVAATAQLFVFVLAARIRDTTSPR